MQNIKSNVKQNIEKLENLKKELIDNGLDISKTRKDRQMANLANK